MTGSVKQPPELKKKAFTRKQWQLHNFKTGLRGESTAVDFLKRQGYRVVEKNVSFRGKEVDIIAWDPDDVLCFIEVKTRLHPEFGHPSDAITKTKLWAMQYVAKVYLTTKKLQHIEHRFDLIAVFPNNVEHFENITWFA